MALIVVFLLGIANFACHRAAVESGHPMLGKSPWFVHLLGGRVPWLTEFALLVAALLLTAQGSAWPAWAYLGYSLLNGLAAWLIVTRRV